MSDGVRFEQCQVRFGDRAVLHDLTLDCVEGRVTALLGATGSGKTTMLRAVNRMIERDGGRREGAVLLGDTDVGEISGGVEMLRRQAPMVTSPGRVFPLSILENVQFALRVAGVPRTELGGRTEQALRRVNLWNDVERRLGQPASTLTPGRQQLLCIARAVALEPRALLLDEPSARLDPVASGQVDEVIRSFRERYTVLVATRSVQQAGRVADFTAFLSRGTVVESGPTESLFTNPRKTATEAYLSRRFA